MIGPGAIFLANGGSYLVVVAVLGGLNTRDVRPMERSNHRESGIVAGLQHARRSPSIVVAAVLAFVVAAFGRNYQVTMAAMSTSVFRTGATGYGALSVVFAIGALFGGVAATRVRHHRARTVVVIALVAAALEMSCALAPSLLVFAAVIFPIAMTAVMFDTVVSCVVQTASGDAHRGRTLALLATVSMLGATAGAPTLGWLCDHIGGRVSLELGGVVVLVAALATRRLVDVNPSAEARL
jgi:predicted MFS family arabinose efflux permease